MILINSDWKNLAWDIYLSIDWEGFHFELTLNGWWLVFSFQNINPLIKEDGQ